MNKKTYIKPTVETINLEQNESLLAGSPEFHDEYSGNGGYSRAIEELSDEVDELTGQINRLIIINK